VLLLLKIRYLHNWISELPESVRGEVVQRCAVRDLTDGECLYRLGDIPEACFQVVKGRIKICNFNHAGQELVHSYLIEGDCCGDGGMIGHEPRINFAIACGEVQANVLYKTDFDYFYEKYPEVAKALNRVMFRRLRHQFMVAEDACLLPLHQRLARAIVRMAHSVGEVHADGSATIEDISHDELGKMVGATRQSVGRELKKLEREGSIEINYGKLSILDVAVFGAHYDRLVSVEPVVPEYNR
jgi:CRP/FNR family transcriptional regulator, cyclic AMP receptor protein